MIMTCAFPLYIYNSYLSICISVFCTCMYVYNHPFWKILLFVKGNINRRSIQETECVGRMTKEKMYVYPFSPFADTHARNIYGWSDSVSIRSHFLPTKSITIFLISILINYYIEGYFSRACIAFKEEEPVSKIYVLLSACINFYRKHDSHNAGKKIIMLNKGITDQILNMPNNLYLITNTQWP